MKNILVVGYPRSGNTWFNSLLSYYFNAPYYDAAIEEAILTGQKLSDAVLAYNDRELSGKHQRFNQKREIRSIIQVHALPDRLWHTYPNFLTQQDYNSDDFLVMVIREPKDVAVSYFYYTLFCVRSFEQHWSLYLPNLLREWFYQHFYFQDFVLKSAREWTNFYQGWLGCNPLVIHYESLQQDTIAQIQRLTDVFDLSFSTQYAKEAKDFCFFSNLRQREDRHRNLKKPIPQNERFIRSGKTGTWKQYFSASLAEKFDNITDIITTKIPHL